MCVKETGFDALRKHLSGVDLYGIVGKAGGKRGRRKPGRACDQRQECILEWIFGRKSDVERGKLS